MKCVCPSGGDRTCPDDCLLAVWHNLPVDDRKKRRKPIVEQLYRQGYTQEHIATQLGVSQSTIRDDLKTLVASTNVKGQGKDTLGRKKSTGRTKGKRTGPQPSRRKNEEQQEAMAAALVLDQGKSYEEAARIAGLQSVQVVKTAVAREQGRREPQVDRGDLSMSAQEKLDAALRQHKRKLDLMFEQRVLEEVRRRIDEMILPHWKKQIDEAQELYKHRRGAMDKATFNKIRRGLHPDSRNSISDKMLGEAFDTFMSLEKFLLDEKDSPTEVGAGLPRTWADWEKAKQAATAERRAKRGNHQLRRQ